MKETEKRKLSETGYPGRDIPAKSKAWMPNRVRVVMPKL
jgi:hypothetical protein